MLQKKSLTELRGIAQSFGIDKIFEKGHSQLVQDIEMKQQGLIPKPKIEIPHPVYDARLMTKPPSKLVTVSEAEQMLKPYIARGLHFTCDDETWCMSFGKKNDQGTMRMPIRVLLRCADKVMG